MTRILIYCTQMMPTGGIESHIAELCRHLSAPDVKIDLLVANFRMGDTERNVLSSDVQKKLYHDHFAVPVLIKRWRELFNVN